MRGEGLLSGEPQAGARIASRFVLERLLGKGGFGEVWFARDESREGVGVAIKLLHENNRQRAATMQRFEREARVISELNHPNIARAVDFSTSSAPPYLAMEFVEGSTLETLMIERASRGQTFSREELLAIAEQLCSAVAHANQRGIVHRDLKPRNVMIAPSDLRLKVLDFGIAKILEEDADRTTTVGRLLGTPYYLSPEQIDSTGVDQRSDVFALATVFFELVTLHRAWLVDKQERHRSLADPDAIGGTHIERVLAISRILRGPRPRPSAVRAGWGVELDLLFERATDLDAERRPAGAMELLESFRAALQHLDRPPVHTETPAPAPDGPDVLDSETPLVTVLTAVMPRDLDSGGEGQTPIVLTREPPSAAPLYVEKAHTRKVNKPRSGARKQPRSAVSAFWLGMAVATSALGGAGAAVVWYSGIFERARDVPVVVAEPAVPRAVSVPTETPGEASSEPSEPAPASAAPLPVAKRTGYASSRRERREAVVAEREAAERAAAEVDSVADLERLLARARANPKDGLLVDQLGDELVKRAGEIAPRHEVVSIQRCATTATMLANLDQLAHCIRKLREVSSP